MAVSNPEIAENAMHFDDEATNMQEQRSHVKNMTPAQAMIMHCTHPPSTHAEFEGLPTNDVRTQVVTTWRNNDILKIPSYSVSTDEVKETQWSNVHDYGFIIPNGARVQYIGAYYNEAGELPPNANYVQDVANTKVQDVFDFSIWYKTVNLYRPVAKSTTIYSNVTAFNNIGSMNVQQFNPAILFAGTLTEFSWQKPKEFAKFIKDGVDGGRIVTTRDEIHSDFNRVPFDHYFREAGIKPSGLSLDPTTTIQVVNLGQIGYDSDKYSIIPSPSQIFSNSSRAYAGKFADGAFAVQRLNTLTPSWLAGTRTDSIMGTPWFGLYECYTYALTETSAPSFVPLKEIHEGKVVILRDTLWTQDMTWSFVRAQGISTNSIGGGFLAGAAPFIMKQYYSMECQPVWNGPWNGLSRVSPAPDAAALQALMDTFYGMPDAMPSKYNFLGTVLPFLSKIAPTVLPFVAKLFKGERKEEKREVREDSRTNDSVERLSSLVEQLLRGGKHDTERLSLPQPVRRERPLRTQTFTNSKIAGRPKMSKRGAKSSKSK